MIISPTNFQTSISSFEIINIVVPDPKIWLASSIAAAVDAAAVNPIGIKVFLTNGLSTFLIRGKPVFNNDPKSLPKNPSDFRQFIFC